MERERNYLIDAIKCLACFGVVMIHMPTQHFGDEFYYMETVLGRCGVPIFFMISGYFAARHVKKDPENSGRWFLKNALRMIWQFVIFSVIIFAFYRLGNLLFQMEDMTFTIDKDHIFRLLVFNDPLFGGVLWYLLAYAYCLLIYAAASHFKMGYRLLALVSPLLLLLYYILGRYSVLFFGESLPYYWSRNFLITAIPMFTLGFVMPELNIKWLTNQNILILSIISVLLLFAECMAFYTSLPIGRNNFIFNMPLSFLIVYYATHQPKITVPKDNLLAVIGKKYSLYIYGFQGLAVTLCSRLVMSIVHLDKETGAFVMAFYHISKPICVFLMALLMAFIYVKIVNLLKKQISAARS